MFAEAILMDEQSRLKVKINKKTQDVLHPDEVVTSC